MNYKNILIVLAFAICLGAVFFVYQSNHKKMVYVKIGELYEEFQMKKELENSYTMVQTERKRQLDSLELELKMLDKKISDVGERKDLVELFEGKRENYLLKKKQFEEDDAQMQQQYSEKIRKQLNQYVMDYGKETNCDYVFGAEGSGALMFSKENNDVTKEVIAFINDKYKGLK